MTQQTHDEGSDNQEPSDDRFVGRTGSAAELHAAPDQPTRAELRALGHSLAAAAGEGAESGEEMSAEKFLALTGHAADDPPAAENGGLMIVEDHGSVGGSGAASAGDAPDDPMLRFFVSEHLPAALRAVSQPFGMLALELVAKLPRSPERTVALGKLLESNDCAVRAALS